MKRICIIGGGCSGTLMATYLMNSSLPGAVELTLIERSGDIGYGVAYSTDKEWHILNTPVSKMSIYEDDNKHFKNWLESKGVRADEGDFVQRHLFGDYLKENYLEAAARFSEHSTLHIEYKNAEDLTRHNGYYRLVLGGGRILYADIVIIAAGYNGVLNSCTLLDTLEPAGKDVFYNPWSLTEGSLSTDDDIFILGTGLTMVDKCLDLYYSNHKGSIYALSTHGLLPNTHEPVQAYPSFYNEIENETSIANIFHIIRSHIKTALAKGISWVSVLETLRHHNSKIWISLSPEEKEKFLRHLKHIWNISRHRMPAQTAAVINQMRATGRLKIFKGRLSKIEPACSSYKISYDNAAENGFVTAEKIINCTGMSIAENCRTTLLTRILKSGLAAKDELRIGIKGDESFRVLEASGNPVHNLYALGPVLMGCLGESTSAVDIKQHAKQLADIILRENKLAEPLPAAGIPV